MDVETLIKNLRNNAFISKSLSFIKTNKLFLRLTSVCLVAVLSLVVTVVSVGLTVGFNVNYLGKVIATVEDSSVFENAKDIAVQNVNSEGAEIAIASPKYSLTVTVLDKLDTATKVADAIIKNTDGFVSGSALVVNGETLACVEDGSLEEKVENRRTAYYIEGAENTANFVDEVNIEKGYYLKKDITDSAYVDMVIENLQVATVSKVNSNVALPFETKEVKTDEETVGYRKVTQSGRNGTALKVEEVVTVNGAESSRTVISQTTVSDPVDKVVTVGTAPKRVNLKKANSSNAGGFISPINAGQYTISSYYGDGRNHKAWDYAADKGVAIFAVASGKVTYASYDSDYGYNIIIDHGNGLKTRYAHACALYVSVGTEVSQGQQIAAVGNTGRSTGNHLHFEVIVNGVRVNPANYMS